jgi:hypothetical protein
LGNPVDDPFEIIGIRCVEMALELRRMMLNIPDDHNSSILNKRDVDDVVIRLGYVANNLAGVRIYITDRH